MKRSAALALVAVLAVAAAGLSLAARSQTPPPPDVVVDQVEICHAPPAPGRQTVSVDSILRENGHDDHETDIIPPFTYDGGTYPGKNWDSEGQEAWNDDCSVPDVTPLLACVESGQNGLTAHFGYRSSESEAVHIEVGSMNKFDPPPENRTQPTTFQPGTHADVLTVPFQGQLSWRLAAKSVTASTNSTRCQGSLRIDKALDPENDAGRFDLLLDGQALVTSVGQGGTTGTQAVTASPAGTQHTVSERAASGTSLANYVTTIACRDNGGAGTIVAQGTGTSLDVTVRQGEAIVCVILNKRGAQPPDPGPEQADLAIVKTAAPRSLLVGEQVTWTVTLTNKGPKTATSLVVNDALPRDMSFVEGSLVLPPGMTCVGAHCTLRSLAAGASVTGRFVTTATAVGTKTNTVTVDADQDDANPADNAASAHVVVTSRAVEVVTPVLECVNRLPGGLLRAHFGYLNRGSNTVGIPVGPRNAFTPEPANRGQPVRFRSGRVPDVFQVDFRGTLVWRLTGRTATASATSRRCGPASGTLRIDKILLPNDDPGRFNLEIDGLPAGTGRGVGNLGTTGDVAVSAGRHRVGEKGVEGTSLADYETTIACRGARGRGVVRSAFEGPELVVDVGAGQEVVCTIVNTRRAPAEPPQPSPSEPTPLPLPEPATSDLAVRKFVDRSIGALGDIATWTIVVTNNGPVAATGVRIVDEAAAGATFVSLDVSQGTCGRTSCALGTIQPGDSVRIVARTRMLTVGARLNTVLVSGDQPDSNPENNAASALVRVLSAFKPPLQLRCGRLSVDRRLARAGTEMPVRADVRNVFGQPLEGTVVRARGAGQRTAARTNGRGVATLQLSPTTPGIVRFTVGARTLTAAGARLCTARVGVLGAAGLAPGVTG